MMPVAQWRGDSEAAGPGPDRRDTRGPDPVPGAALGTTAWTRKRRRGLGNDGVDSITTAWTRMKP
jgi:hypothetical protein